MADRQTAGMEEDIGLACPFELICAASGKLSVCCAMCAVLKASRLTRTVCDAGKSPGPPKCTVCKWNRWPLQWWQSKATQSLSWGSFYLSTNLWLELPNTVWDLNQFPLSLRLFPFLSCLKWSWTWPAQLWSLVVDHSQFPCYQSCRP